MRDQIVVVVLLLLLVLIVSQFKPGSDTKEITDDPETTSDDPETTNEFFPSLASSLDLYSKFIAVASDIFATNHRNDFLEHVSKEQR